MKNKNLSISKVPRLNQNMPVHIGLKDPNVFASPFNWDKVKAISGPLYSYALESFNARWTPIVYDVSIRSIVLRWTQSFPIEWTQDYK